MPRRYWLLPAILIVLAGAVVISCSGKKSTDPKTEPEPEPTADTVLNWVGTNVVYHEAVGKHDLSIIFVLAEWCGWCRRMKTETLADSTVIHMLNESFNIVHVNPDVDSMVVYRDSTVSCGDLAGAVYGVRAYPAMLFFTRNGDMIDRRLGYRPAAGFLSLLDSVRAGEP
jgi:thioredoxin-related protein